MGLNLPGWAREAMAWAGVTWPEADEEVIFDMATQWRTFASDTEQVVSDALQQVNDLVSKNESDGLAAFQKYWEEVAGDSGYMHNSRATALSMAVFTYAVAAYILALKLAAMAQLIALAVIIAAAIASAWFTVGASLAAAAEAAVTVNRTIHIAVQGTIQAINTQGRIAAEAISLLLKESIKHLEHRPIHDENSPDRQEPGDESINDRLDNAETATKQPGAKRNSVPVEGPPNGIVKKVNPQTGEITGYAEYDSQGRIVKRVDLTGATHGGVPTPHVVYYDWNTRPDGSQSPQQQKTVRPAYPSEIP